MCVCSLAISYCGTVLAGWLTAAAAAAAAAACVEFCLLFRGLSLSYCFFLWGFLASIDR